MSRVYDALQKSQGENPNASPLAPSQPEPAPWVASTAEGVLASVPVPPPPMIAETGIPGAGATTVPTMDAPEMPTARSDAKWLNVPSDRVLRPEPRPEQRLVSIAAPDSPGAEMFRVLSTRLGHMQRKRSLHKLLITSSEADEGKSIVALNLAFAMARRPSQRVLLIEADLRRPTASFLLSNSDLQGITEWSEGKLAIEDALYRVNDLPFWFLSAGRGVEEPMPLLESDRFAKMLEAVSSNFDWVLLDATPMLPIADSTSLSRLCDGVLVVIREGHTRRRVLKKALESIEKNKLLGAVFNEASMLKIGYDRYYGGKYGKAKKDAKKETDKVNAATA